MYVCSVFVTLATRFETAKQRLCAHLALLEAISVYQYPQSAGMVIHVSEVASARLETSGTEVAYIYLSTYICIHINISDIWLGRVFAFRASRMLIQTRVAGVTGLKEHTRECPI